MFLWKKNTEKNGHKMFVVHFPFCHQSQVLRLYPSHRVRHSGLGFCPWLDGVFSMAQTKMGARRLRSWFEGFIPVRGIPNVMATFVVSCTDVHTTSLHQLKNQNRLQNQDTYHIYHIYIYTTGKKYEIFFISATFCIFVGCAGCFCTWNTFLRAEITFKAIN